MQCNAKCLLRIAEWLNSMPTRAEIVFKNKY
jgi:hypothetical protein